MTHRSYLGRKTLYDVLGIPPSSTRQEIKTQFYKLSLLYHPDRADSEGSITWRQEKFVQISRAYSILSNDLQRKSYDNDHGIFGDKHMEALRPIWDPCPGSRHTTDSRTTRVRNNFIKETIKDRTMDQWVRWIERSQTNLQKINDARIFSENEQREDSIIRRNRILASIFIISCYLLACFNTDQ